MREKTEKAVQHHLKSKLLCNHYSQQNRSDIFYDLRLKQQENVYSLRFNMGSHLRPNNSAVHTPYG